MLHLALGDKLPGFTNIKTLVKKALDNIFGGFRGLVEPSLFKATYKTLENAIDEGVARIEYNKPSEAFVKQLKKSGAWFSARKSYQQQQELAALLTNDAGTGKRTWNGFRKASKSIVGNYNERWLKVEYDTAIASARNAGLWQQYAQEQSAYPNLKYLASRAATPREEHKPYYNVVRPIDDDFWVRHYPPSAFNCQCGVEQTTDAITNVSPGTKESQPAPGLDHNPGKTGEIFSKSHPYSADLNDDLRKQIDDEGERLMNEPDGDE